MKSIEQPTLTSFKNMLLATDLSPASEMALRYAQALGREHGAQVHTLHVSGRDDYQLLCPEAFATTFNGPHNASRCSSEVLRELLLGLPCEVPLHGSKVWEIIADVVARNEIDLLILGTHGRKGLQRLLFGSVAEEVFRNVSCPVLTVGSDVGNPGSDGLEIRRVLLATDFNPCTKAPACAHSLCEQFSAELSVLHVAGADEPSGPEMPWRQVRDQIASIAPKVMDLGRKPAFLVEYGEPAAKILQVAGELEADLIVLGARHPRDATAASHLPWATAGRVISGAHCPVLTVRDPDVAG